MVAFVGEEVSALVMDFGSSLSKIGYAGEDTPKYVFPSHVGALPNSAPLIGDTKLYKPARGLEIESAFENGLISNWDRFEQLWEYAYKTALNVQSKEHPVVFADPSWDTKQNREKLCELAFEKFDIPGFYLGRSAVLSAYFQSYIDLLPVDQLH
jgi:actin-related protein